MTLSLATFNLCNLQLSGRPMFGDFAWTPAQYGKKVRWTAEMLAAHPAQIFCLQELWSEQCLQEVLTEAGLPDYQLVCFAEKNADKDGRDMHVAAALHPAIEILNSEWLHAFPADMQWQSTDPRYAMALHISHFSRPVLKLNLRTQTGKALCVFIVHLKSRLPVAPFGKSQKNNNSFYGVGANHWLDIGRALSAARRAAEIAVLRVAINHELAQNQSAVIVAGDFNDRYPGAALDILTGEARFRKQGTNRSGRRADWGLYHLLQLAEYNKSLTKHLTDYITFHGDDEQLALDHMLFSWQFHPRSVGKHWRLQRWEIADRHLSHRKPHMSDHALVRAVFSSTT